MSTRNLDQWAAQAAQNIVDDQDAKQIFKAINTALGVLQSQGVYACMLYLYAEDNAATRSIRTHLWSLLERLEQHLNIQWQDEENRSVQRPHVHPARRNSKKDVLGFYATAIAPHLDTLLLVRDLYEQTLTYARYHAKALGA